MLRHTLADTTPSRHEIAKITVVIILESKLIAMAVILIKSSFVGWLESM